MIQSLLESYIGYVIGLFNAENPDNELIARSILKTDEQSGTFENERHYEIYFVDSEPMEAVSSKNYQVRARIDFYLKLLNNQHENYKSAVDSYLWNLKRKFYYTEKTEGAYKDNAITDMTINNIIAIRETGGDKVTTDYFNPSMELVLNVWDDNI